jgi:hypothetical protein
MVEIDCSFIYGVLFAHYLVKGNDSFEAYQDTVRAFLKGKEFIRKELNEYIALEEDLAKHLNNLDDRINENIFYWGSSVFFQ